MIIFYIFRLEHTGWAMSCPEVSVTAQTVIMGAERGAHGCVRVRVRVLVLVLVSVHN